VEYQNPIPRILKHPLRVTALMRLTLHWIRAYFTAQQENHGGPHTVVETAVDDRVPVDGRAIYPYLFAGVYVMYTAWTILDQLPAAQYRRAKSAFFAMIDSSREIFVRWPTRMRGRGRDEHPLLAYAQEIDGPTNCYPSLHVGITALAFQILRGHEELEPQLLAAMRRAYVEICRSTMQTKQHSMVDVLGGLELARQIYQRHFDGEYEDLAAEILEELTAEELGGAQRLCAEEEDLGALLPQLLAYFEKL